MPRKERTAIEKRKRAEHRRLGLCTMCSEPAEPGRRKCDHHIDLNAARAKRHYTRCLAEGQCQKCSRLVFAGSTYCERHMKAKRRVRRAKYGHRPKRPGGPGPVLLENRAT